MAKSTNALSQILVQLSGAGQNWELNGSLQSKIMAMVFSIASEIERDLISKRTKEALRTHKVAGVKLGRPRGAGKSKLDEYKEEIVALLRNGSSKKFVANRFGTSQVNLYNWLRKNSLNATCQKAFV